MNTENEIRRALIARLVAILCKPLQNILMIYRACDSNDGIFLDFLTASSKDRAFRHVWIKVLSKSRSLRELNLTEEDRKARLVEAFVGALRDWMNKEPENELSDEDLYWLTDVTERLGISDLIWIPILKQIMGHDYDKYLARFKEIKQEGYIPETMSAEGYAVLLLTIRDFNLNRLPTNHSLWKLFGVKTYTEYRKQGLSRVFREAQYAKTGKLSVVYKALVTAVNKASDSRGTNTRTTTIEGIGPIKDPYDLSGGVGNASDLHGIIRTARLSRQEKIVVKGWETGELAIPPTRRGYGRVKEFAELRGIPSKAVYVLEARAMKKLQKVVEMTE